MQRREQQDVQRIGRLEQRVVERRGNMVAGKEVQRGHTLQAQRPEHHQGDEQQQQREIALGLHRVAAPDAAEHEIQHQQPHQDVHRPAQDHRVGQQFGHRPGQHGDAQQGPYRGHRPMQVIAPGQHGIQLVLAPLEQDGGREHAHGRGHETPAQPVALADEIGAHERRDEGTQVDGQVEQRVATLALAGRPWRSCARSAPSGECPGRPTARTATGRSRIRSAKARPSAAATTCPATATWPGPAAHPGSCRPRIHPGWAWRTSAPGSHWPVGRRAAVPAPRPGGQRTDQRCRASDRHENRRRRNSARR